MEYTDKELNLRRWLREHEEVRFASDRLLDTIDAFHEIRDYYCQQGGKEFEAIARECSKTIKILNTFAINKYFKKK